MTGAQRELNAISTVASPRCGQGRIIQYLLCGNESLRRTGICNQLQKICGENFHIHSLLGDCTLLVADRGNYLRKSKVCSELD